MLDVIAQLLDYTGSVPKLHLDSDTIVTLDGFVELFGECATVEQMLQLDAEKNYGYAEFLTGLKVE